jgi:hypothetical protein
VVRSGNTIAGGEVAGVSARSRRGESLIQTPATTAKPLVRGGISSRCGRPTEGCFCWISLQSWASGWPDAVWFRLVERDRWLLALLGEHQGDPPLPAG